MMMMTTTSMMDCGPHALARQPHLNPNPNPNQQHANQHQQLATCNSTNHSGQTATADNSLTRHHYIHRQQHHHSQYVASAQPSNHQSPMHEHQHQQHQQHQEHHYQSQQQQQTHHLNHQNQQPQRQLHSTQIYGARQCQQQPMMAVNAPPTPPSDELAGPPPTNYLAPQQHEARIQTGAWVMQTLQQQHETRLLQPIEHMSQQQQQQQNGFAPQIISSYYYDIDDGFSDIMSAPATPEPSQIDLQPQQQLHDEALAMNQFEQQQQQVADYNTYLPYNADQQHQHQRAATMQPGQQMLHVDQMSIAYSVAMSPDSSLSTTSSSPSDHSLYQPSPGQPQSQAQQQQQQPIVLRHQHQHQRQPMGAQLCMTQGSYQQQQASDCALVQQTQALAKVEPQVTRTAEPTKGTTTTHVHSQPHPHPHHRSSPIHLWEFLKELLGQVESASGANSPGAADATIIRWLDRQRGVFKIEDSVRVAKLWGKRKNKPKMNYDKLSRSIRQYYKKGIMKKTDRSQRLVYQFCSAYCH